jgi:hypothetical protein
MAWACPSAAASPDRHHRRRLNGLDLHLNNETAESLSLQMDLVCLRDGAVAVASATRAVELSPHSTRCIAAADCLGQFFDFTCVYRFGPRANDVTIATLPGPGGRSDLLGSVPSALPPCARTARPRPHRHA